MILVSHTKHSVRCSHSSSSSFMLKGKLPKPVLCSVISGSKCSLKVQTPLFISTPPNSQQTSGGCQDSRAGCHALPMGQSPASPLREAGGCNLVLGCWHPPGLLELPLPKRSTPLQGKPSLSALLEEWDLQVFALSRNTLTPDEGLGLMYTAGYLTALISPSHRTDTVISDKGKICLERDLATHYLILVFWYFRYRNAFPLFTALCHHCLITSQYQSPFSKIPPFSLTS